MNIKDEILAGAISDTINSVIRHIDLNVEETINSIAMIILDEIKSILQNTEISDDFSVVEEIVNIFEKYNIDTGTRHDF